MALRRPNTPVAKAT